MSWERVSFLELGSYETAPGTARWHARNVLRDWGLERHEEVTQLILSELVTNSVLAAHARPWRQLPPVRLWLLSDSSQVLQLVWDALPGMPVPRKASHDDESGRGLFLVKELSAAWGSYRPARSYAPEHDGGKVTWASIGATKGETR
ncbi:MAG TPA: ATP-binding protein [Trebonia sp.]|nr:ATP-binding protein [Trebonia sp.]